MREENRQWNLTKQTHLPAMRSEEAWLGSHWDGETAPGGEA